MYKRHNCILTSAMKIRVAIATAVNSNSNVPQERYEIISMAQKAYIGHNADRYLGYHTIYYEG